jgi:hypothetical protein
MNVCRRRPIQFLEAGGDAAVRVCHPLRSLSRKTQHRGQCLHEVVELAFGIERPAGAVPDGLGP